MKYIFSKPSVSEAKDLLRKSLQPAPTFQFILTVTSIIAAVALLTTLHSSDEDTRKGDSYRAGWILLLVGTVFKLFAGMIIVFQIPTMAQSIDLWPLITISTTMLFVAGAGLLVLASSRHAQTDPGVWSYWLVVLGLLHVIALEEEV